MMPKGGRMAGAMFDDELEDQHDLGSEDEENSEYGDEMDEYSEGADFGNYEQQRMFMPNHQHHRPP